MEQLSPQNFQRLPAAWVEDATPVAPRAATGSPGDVFTFEELCKIYCWPSGGRF